MAVATKAELQQKIKDNVTDVDLVSSLLHLADVVPEDGGPIYEAIENVVDDVECIENPEADEEDDDDDD